MADKKNRVVKVLEFAKKTMNATKRQLILNKGQERFIFRYDAGSEDQLLDSLVEQAQDKRTQFDWFDAAVLSFKLTHWLIGEAEELLGKSRDTQISAQ